MQIDEDGRKVSNWLVAALTHDKAKTVTIDEFPVRTKKIRDECIAIKGNEYFRRSAFYTVTKMILYHSLTMYRGKSIGRFIYKVLMLRFMNDTCRSFVDAPSDAINIDLMSQAIAKMARRIEKLQDEYTTIMAIRDDISNFDDIFKRVLDDTKKTVAQIRSKIDDQIKTLETKVSDEAHLLPLTGLSILDDSKQRIPTLNKYIETRKMDIKKIKHINQPQIKLVKRHYEKQRPPDETAFNGDDDMTAFLYDIEWFILYETHLDPIEMIGEQIKNLIDNYVRHASTVYKNTDKLGISRMILTRLKLLALLDRVACNDHPMLLQHRPSVNLLWFDELLLPQRVDMEVAYELEQYFRGRHDKGSFPGLIESNQIDGVSFSVRYARDSYEMQQLRDEIVTMGDEKVAEKKMEWERERDNIADLRRRREQLLSCDQHTNRHGYTHHCYYCKRCSLDRQIDNSKISDYEYPMPADVDEQYAIAFEFRIPPNIAYLRDALYDFNEYRATDRKRLDIKGNWENHDQLGRYIRFKSRDVLIGRNTIPRIDRRHVDYSFELFIIRTTNNCILHANKQSFSTPIGQDEIRSICAMSVEPNSPYSNLQWTLHGTDHTQNQVLAKQSECSQTLSLAEYTNFGSLRADGCRLQWRKLFGMIECEALSFEQMSVVSLCLQAIWQQNGVDPRYKWLRATNVDLRNNGFAMAMIDLLNKFVDQQRCNWFHPTKLLLAALLVVRCIEINEKPKVFDKCMKLLRKQREIAIEWCEKITIHFFELANANQAAEMKLRRALMLAAIAGCATYFVHAKHKFFEQIYQEADTSIWLQLIVTLNNNLIITGTSSDSLMFLRLVQNIGINLETKIKAVVKNNPSYAIDFVRKQCPAATDFSAKLIGPQTLGVDFNVNGTKSHVTIDIIGGTYLVNNQTISRLSGELQWF